MYGLILENLAEYIRQAYGEETWESIRRQAGVNQSAFSVHQVFPETVVPILAKKAQQVLGVSDKEFMNSMGVFFVNFVGQYGYDKVLGVLGRHLRDFLNGLDNLHEYLKFSYPKLKAPSFMCENETRHGLTLHYKTKRTGFVFYTMGQITAVAKIFYHKDLSIEVLNEEIETDTLHVTFQLTFDNRAFTLASLSMTRDEKHLPVSAAVLFEIFPFCIVFGNDLIIKSIGNSLMVILPELLGKKITMWFELVRPLIAFKFNTILNRRHNIFEMVTVGAPVHDREDNPKGVLREISESGGNAKESQTSKALRLKAAKEKRDGTPFGGVNRKKKPGDVALKLKGQMIYMENWKLMMYLATPVMPDLSALVKTGLYINDLSMHDFSRDLMLAGAQQSVELKLALDQEQQKSKKLEDSMKKLDEEMKRTDELLYQMIPKQVADRLRTGMNPVDTCEIFDSVSILFSDVVTFTEICSRITPMEVVSMLNAMYSIFDTLTEKNKVYKVETIGDAYMVVGGAPDKDVHHAERVCDMAMDMVDAITDLKDPSTGKHLNIRVGVHSGAVVAGIVGLKMPRYCLFGDSVNTASRMESTSEAMKIHISQSTKDLIPASYHAVERGEIIVKGKGSMKTYWLTKIDNRIPLQKSGSPKAAWGQAQAGTPIPPRSYTPIHVDESRKLSAGTITAYSPSDVFGSVVSDDNFDYMNDLCTPDGEIENIADRQNTAPGSTNNHRKTKEVFAEINMDKLKSPPHSTPGSFRRYKNKSELELSDTESQIDAKRTISCETIEIITPIGELRIRLNVRDRSSTAPGYSFNHRIAKEEFSEYNMMRPVSPACSFSYRKTDDEDSELSEMDLDHLEDSGARADSGELSEIPSEFCSPTIDAHLVGFSAERHASAPWHTDDYNKAKDLFEATLVGTPESRSSSAPAKPKKHRKVNKGHHDNQVITINLPHGETRKYSIYSERTASEESLEIPSNISTPDWDEKPDLNYMDIHSSAPDTPMDHRDTKELFTAIHVGRPKTPSVSARHRRLEDDYLQSLMEQGEESGVSSVRPTSAESMSIPSELCSPTIDAHLCGHNADRHSTAPPHTREYLENKDIFTSLHGVKTEIRTASAPAKPRKHRKVNKDQPETQVITIKLPHGETRKYSIYSERTMSVESMEIPSAVSSPDWDYKPEIDMLERCCTAPGATCEHRDNREMFANVHVGKLTSPPCSAKQRKPDDDYLMSLVNRGTASRATSVRPMSAESMSIPSELCSPTIDSHLIGHNSDGHASAPPHTREHAEKKEAFKIVHVGKPDVLRSCSAPAKPKKHRKVHTDHQDVKVITIQLPHGATRKYSINSERSMSTTSMDIPSAVSSPDWDLKPEINLMDRSCTAPGASVDHKDAKEFFSGIHVGRSKTPPVSAKHRKPDDEYLASLMEQRIESRIASVRPDSDESMGIPSELCSPSIDSKLIGRNLENHCSAPPHSREHVEIKEMFTSVHVGRSESRSCSAPSKMKRQRKTNQTIVEPAPLPFVPITVPPKKLLERSFTGSTMSNESMEIPSAASSPDWDYTGDPNMNRSCTAPGCSLEFKEAKEIFTALNVGKLRTPPCSAKMRKPDDEYLKTLVEMELESSVHLDRRESSGSLNIPSELCSPSIDARLIGHNSDRHSTAPAHTRDHFEAKETFTAIHVGFNNKLRSCSAPAKSKKHRKVTQYNAPSPHPHTPRRDISTPNIIVSTPTKLKIPTIEEAKKSMKGAKLEETKSNPVEPKVIENISPNVPEQPSAEVEISRAVSKSKEVIKNRMTTKGTQTSGKIKSSSNPCNGATKCCGSWYSSRSQPKPTPSSVCNIS